MVSRARTSAGGAAGVTAFLWIEAAALSVASLVHSGLLMPGHAHAHARTAEALLAGVLFFALAIIAFLPAATRTLAILAQGFVLFGVLVGVFTIAVGVGPQTAADVVYHALLTGLLLAGIRHALAAGR